MEFTIDAQGKTIGRIASEAAHILMGKNSPSFERNKSINQRVRIINSKGVKVDPEKALETTFATYSGYPGGLTRTSMKDMIEKKGISAVIERAVHGMIPNNKLKKDILKNLTVSE